MIANASAGRSTPTNSAAAAAVVRPPLALRADFDDIPRPHATERPRAACVFQHERVAPRRAPLSGGLFCSCRAEPRLASLWSLHQRQAEPRLPEAVVREAARWPGRLGWRVDLLQRSASRRARAQPRWLTFLPTRPSTRPVRAGLAPLSSARPGRRLHLPGPVPRRGFPLPCTMAAPKPAFDTPSDRMPTPRWSLVRGHAMRFGRCVRRRGQREYCHGARGSWQAVSPCGVLVPVSAARPTPAAPRTARRRGGPVDERLAGAHLKIPKGEGNEQRRARAARGLARPRTRPCQS